jgi:hypothetical protein
MKRTAMLMVRYNARTFVGLGVFLIFILIITFFRGTFAYFVGVD